MWSFFLSSEGGVEYIPNPYSYVYGYVQDMVFGEEDNGVFFEVDFGAYLDIQLVSVDDCDPWEPPVVSTEGAAAIDHVIHVAKVENFRPPDIQGISTVGGQWQWLPWPKF